MGLLKRYFRANKAAIISVQWRGGWSHYIPARGGNFGGFYWGPFVVRWRMPYARVWQWHDERQAWEPRQ